MPGAGPRRSRRILGWQRVNSTRLQPRIRITPWPRPWCASCGTCPRGRREARRLRPPRPLARAAARASAARACAAVARFRPRPGLAPRPPVWLGMRLRSRAGPQRRRRRPPRPSRLPAPVTVVTVATRGRPRRRRCRALGLLRQPGLLQMQVAETETARAGGMFHGATCAAATATATRAVAMPQVPARPPSAGPSQRLRPLAGAMAEALVRSGSIMIDLRSSRAREPAGVRSSSPIGPRWEPRLPTWRCRRPSAAMWRRSSGGNIYTPNSLYKIPVFLEPDPGKS